MDVMEKKSKIPIIASQPGANGLSERSKNFHTEPGRTLDERELEQKAQRKREKNTRKRARKATARAEVDAEAADGSAEDK